jgi:hypothetical protein
MLAHLPLLASAYVSIRQHTSAYVRKLNVRAPASLGGIWLSLCDAMQQSCMSTLSVRSQRERDQERGIDGEGGGREGRQAGRDTQKTRL